MDAYRRRDIAIDTDADAVIDGMAQTLFIVSVTAAGLARCLLVLGKCFVFWS